MTDLFINCTRHGKSKVKEWNLSYGDITTGCGCRFRYNSGYIIDVTGKNIKKDTTTYIDDHKGGMYQDGSREFEGGMLQDGSFI